MSYPTMNKAMLKLGKPMARKLLEQPSAWVAHKEHKCMQHCWYCGMERRMHAKSESQTA